MQLTIASHLPNLKLFVTSCRKDAGSAWPLLSAPPRKAGDLNQEGYSDSENQPNIYILKVLPERAFFPLSRVPVSERVQQTPAPTEAGERWG